MAGELWQVRSLWADKEGKRSALGLRFPSDITVDTAYSRAMVVLNAAAALSDAVLVGVKVYKEYVITPTPTAGLFSNSKRYGWLFYRNAEGMYEEVRVPSIKTELLESSGPYFGIRLVEALTAEGAPLLSMESVLAATIDSDGLPWAYTYVNGGLLL